MTERDLRMFLSITLRMSKEEIAKNARNKVLKPPKKAA